MGWVAVERKKAREQHSHTQRFARRRFAKAARRKQLLPGIHHHKFTIPILVRLVFVTAGNTTLCSTSKLSILGRTSAKNQTNKTPSSSPLFHPSSSFTLPLFHPFFFLFLLFLSSISFKLLFLTRDIRFYSSLMYQNNE